MKGEGRSWAEDVERPVIKPKLRGGQAHLGQRKERGKRRLRAKKKESWNVRSSDFNRGGTCRGKVALPKQ